MSIWKTFNLHPCVIIIIIIIVIIIIIFYRHFFYYGHFMDLVTLVFYCSLNNTDPLCIFNWIMMTNDSPGQELISLIPVMLHQDDPKVADSFLRLSFTLFNISSSSLIILTIKQIFHHCPLYLSYRIILLTIQSNQDE